MGADVNNEQFLEHLLKVPLFPFLPPLSPPPSSFFFFPPLSPFSPPRREELSPASAPHVDKALYPPRQHSAVPTLAIVFDCGYCPKGVTGGVIKYLMTNEMKSKYVWELQPDQIFRDQVGFFVGPHFISLCLYPTHFEAIYAPSINTAEAVCSIADICHEVCRSIKLAIEIVSNDINLACHCNTTFYCSLCKSHIAKLKQHDSIPCQLWCDKLSQFCSLPDGYHYWLDLPHQIQSRQTNPWPSNVAKSQTTLTLPSAFEFMLSSASEWKNLGLFLKINIGTLNTIECDHKKANDCLHEMLYIWLKQVDPPPSWQALADAVCHFDPAVSEKIHTTYCNTCA